MAEKRQVVVIVKCKGGHRREIGPGEIPEGGYPICSICYRPMIPVRTESRRTAR